MRELKLLDSSHHSPSTASGSLAAAGGNTMHTLERPPKGTLLSQLFWAGGRSHVGLACLAICVFAMLYEGLNGNRTIIVGTAAILAAVFAMNGLSNTGLALSVLGRREPAWWTSNIFLRLMHFVSAEGELAGIAVATVLLISEWIRIGSIGHIHIAYQEAFTILGIMSAASVAVRNIYPVLSSLERLGGVRLVIIGGSMLCGLTGEPAGAVILTRYFAKRLPDDDVERSRVATGLGATIGSGGGWLPFAAPPVLIIWKDLTEVFGWTIPTLMFMVGVGCLLHVLITTQSFYKLIKPKDLSEPVHWPDWMGFGNLLTITMIVALHIAIPDWWFLYLVDCLAGVLSIINAHYEYMTAPAGMTKRQEEMRREQAFTAKWLPLILAFLMVALEIIGHFAAPAIQFYATFIPTDMPVLWLGVLLFFVTAITSHFADNALATKVLISIPIALISVYGPEVASFLAACVVMGGLFGGILLVPSNLPNFWIARALEISKALWAKHSWKLYPTAVAYLIWIFYGSGEMVEFFKTIRTAAATIGS